MNILFTLCGRAGSKGFRNKNLKLFLGAPLSFYSVGAICLYKEKYKQDNVNVVVNTDSIELTDIIKNGQNEIDVEVIERDKSLAGDKVPKVDVIKDCLSTMEIRNGMVYDLVVDLDITSPMRTVNDIRAAIEKSMSNEKYDVVYSVTDSRRNPYFNMVKEEGGFFCDAFPSQYTTRQETPVFYDMNASIYAYSVSALKNKDSVSFFNNNCSAIIMKDTGILDIDCEEDYELMQVVADYFYSNYSDYREVFVKSKMLLNGCH